MLSSRKWSCFHRFLCKLSKSGKFSFLWVCACADVSVNGMTHSWQEQLLLCFKFCSTLKACRKIYELCPSIQPVSSHFVLLKSGTMLTFCDEISWFCFLFWLNIICKLVPSHTDRVRPLLLKCTWYVGSISGIINMTPNVHLLISSVIIWNTIYDS